MIDSLVILGDNLLGPTLELDALRSYRERASIEHIIAAPARGRDYVLTAANSRLAEATATEPWISRLARIDPNQGTGAIAELHRCVSLGCVGLFLNPDEEVFRIHDAEPLIRVAAELELPTVVVAGVPLRSEPLQVLEVADRVPTAKFVLTSGGQVNISGLGMADAWIALTSNANIAVLSNGEYRQDFLERIPRELGDGRLLYASMAPYYDADFEAARIRNIDYSAAVRAAVEAGTARALFDLP